MRKQWWKLIFALPALAMVLYAGGYISQFIRNYKLWQAAGQIDSPTFPSFELSACIDGLFSFPYGTSYRHLPISIYYSTEPNFCQL